MHLHRSPGLTAIYNAAKESASISILDLGPSKSSTFNFFSDLSSKIIFEGIDEFIWQNQNLEPEEFAAELKDYCLPKKEGQKFDVILAWDYFNYLPFANVIKLMEVLQPWCKPDTLIFTIKYSGKSVPTFPPQFEIQDKHHLRVQRFKTKPRQHVAATIAQFLKHAGEFHIENTISRREGMLPGFTEELLRFQPSHSTRNKLTTVAEICLPQNAGETENAITHRSPGLSFLQQSKNLRCILDLGKKNATNLEMWRSQFHEVFFEDIASSMQWQNTSAHQRDSISPNILQFKHSCFDVIVTWDILNFCSENQLRELADRIRSVCHRNTVVLAMLYTGSSIPSRPARYWMKDDGHVHIESISNQARTSQRLTATGLMRTFGGAKMIGTYAFEEGMHSDIREFLFTVPPLAEAQDKTVLLEAIQ